MSRGWGFSLLLVGMLGLNGCAAGIATSAAGILVRSARGTPQSNAHLTPEAVRACRTHAAQYGTVHVIDVEQRARSRIIVWGTVSDGQGRRSFQCTFGERIVAFQLRAITPRR